LISKAIQANADFKLYARPAANIFYLGINNAVKPFDNIKVRQAIAMRLTRSVIIDNFYPVGSVVADQFMPPSNLRNSRARSKTNTISNWPSS